MGFFSNYRKRRLEKRLQNSPDNPETYIKLANRHRKDGQLDAAIGVLGSGLLRPLDPEDASELLEELERWCRENSLDLKAPIKTLQSLIQQSALAHKGDLLARLQALLEAQASAPPTLLLQNTGQEAISSGEDPATRIRLAQSMLQAGRPTEAAEALAPLGEWPSAPGIPAQEVGLLFAELHFASGNPIQGIERLAALKARAPEAEEAIEKRARQLRRQLATGDLPGLVSPKLKAELEQKLEELIGKAALLERMRLKLARSRESLAGRLDRLLAGGSAVDEEMLEQLEELLITADCGAQTTLAILDRLRQKVDHGQLKEAGQLKAELRSMMLEILRQGTGRVELQSPGPTILLMVGINGAGKTTTMAKLAHRFKEDGKSVLLVAGDTFRAGAIDQLQVWADRIGVPVIRQQEGSDPSAVAFDGVQAARSRAVDVAIIDTAGRLQTKVNLMEELRKIVRIIGRQFEGAPHEVLLVLDGTGGQNALSQAKLFSEVAPVTGIVLTKLDGTAKGGIILSIANEMHIPIKLIGIGERITDLRDFEPELFVEALFSEKTEGSSGKKAS